MTPVAATPGERELAKAERLAVVGEMAASVAHELRNPLAGIQVALSGLKSDLENRKDTERLDLVLGAIWDGMWGASPSCAFVWVRFMGLVAAIGPIVGRLADALEGVREEDSRGISTVGDALAAIGAPVSSVLQHETDLLDGKILVIVQGHLEYLLQVRSLLFEIQVFETELLVA